LRPGSLIRRCTWPVWAGAIITAVLAFLAFRKQTAELVILQEQVKVDREDRRREATERRRERASMVYLTVAFDEGLRAARPPNLPHPLCLTPPKGIGGSSLTVASLMWQMPVSSRRATVMAASTSRAAVGRGVRRSARSGYGSGSMLCQGGTVTVRWPGVPPRMTLRSETSLAVVVSCSSRSGLAITWM